MESFINKFGYTVIEHVIVNPWWVLVIEFFMVLIVYLAIDGIYILLKMNLISKRGEGYSRRTEGPVRILVAGDSTGVGTGAEDVKNTLSGYFAHDFPEVDVVNVSVNGSVTQSVYGQLEAGHPHTYDLVVISTGGNDTWALTPMNKLRDDLRKVLHKAKEMSNQRAIVIFFGNVGSAPFFPYPLRAFLLWRAERINELFFEVTHEEGVPFIELFTQSEKNPFVKDPKKYFALDGLHPNDAGYWEWYKCIWQLMVEKSLVFSGKSIHLKENRE
ncbi:MAG: SGNH/GDSL hydrolase family protein [Candidatus Pacebacteria bacterium]|nr:SGNH/GDSL hydrolase family protein [Candidatus Paceibacterota bacterium]MCF7857387.1 SGNH/GDSL hydrolase family protein [Candidatus Paceibacterota bacterium]